MATELYDGTQELDGTVVRLTADWCMPCKQFAPLFERAATQQDETWLVVDIDDHPDVAQKYGVMSIPAVVVNGEKVDDAIAWTRERM